MNVVPHTVTSKTIATGLADQKVAVLACGSLGSSIVAGLIRLGLAPAQITASARRSDARQALQAQFGIRVSAENDPATCGATVVLLAIKPLQMKSLCLELSPTSPAPLYISVAAGIETAQLASWLPTGSAIVRAMPNTPAALGLAATGLFANPVVSTGQRQLTEQLFAGIGRSVWLPEERWMNWVTALSGSGPAYFFQLMNDMIASAVAAGFPAEAATLLVQQTALGAASLACQSNAPSLEELIRRVRSPGGTTERALNSLAEQDFSGIIARMLTAAESRGREMSEALRTPGPDQPTSTTTK